MKEAGQESETTPSQSAFGEPPPATPASTSSKIALFLLTILAVIVTDALVMLFLPTFQFGPLLEIILNVIILSIVITPILYLLWYAPPKKDNSTP